MECPPTEIKATPTCSRCPHIFFFNDTATTEIYTLSLHDALPISRVRARSVRLRKAARESSRARSDPPGRRPGTRSEEHTSELQSQSNLVCRLLLEKINADIGALALPAQQSHEDKSPRHLSAVNLC